MAVDLLPSSRVGTPITASPGSALLLRLEGDGPRLGKEEHAHGAVLVHQVMYGRREDAPCCGAIIKDVGNTGRRRSRAGPSSGDEGGAGAETALLFEGFPQDAAELIRVA